jgi:hypothetical protein
MNKLHQNENLKSTELSQFKILVSKLDQAETNLKIPKETNSTPSDFLVSNMKDWIEKLNNLNFSESLSATIVLNNTLNVIINPNLIVCSKLSFCQIAALETLFSQTVNTSQGNFGYGLAYYLNNKFLLSPSESKLDRYSNLIELFLARWKDDDSGIKNYTETKETNPTDGLKSFQVRSFFYFYQLCDIVGHVRCLDFLKEKIINNKSQKLHWAGLIQELEKFTNTSLFAYHQFWYHLSPIIEPNINVAKKASTSNQLTINVKNKIYSFWSRPKFVIGEQEHKFDISDKEKTFNVKPDTRVCFDPDFEVLRAIPISETTPLLKSFFFAKKPLAYIDPSIKLTAAQRRQIEKALGIFQVKVSNVLSQKKPTLIITSNPKASKWNDWTHFMKEKSILTEKGIQAIPYVYQGHLANLILHASKSDEILKIISLIQDYSSYQFISLSGKPLYKPSTENALCFLATAN